MYIHRVWALQTIRSDLREGGRNPARTEPRRCDEGSQCKDDQGGQGRRVGRQGVGLTLQHPGIPHLLPRRRVERVRVRGRPYVGGSGRLCHRGLCGLRSHPVRQFPVRAHGPASGLVHLGRYRGGIVLRALGMVAREGGASGELQTVLDAASGLTRMEAENAFSLSLVRNERITADAVWELKTQTLKKSGLLSLHQGTEDFNSLGGLSAISRTATTLEQDGFTDGIDFDDNDRFVLDGQRLICVSGTYGAPDSEYRTEIDSFVRVIAHGTATSGPDYFTVETKSGLTKTYGKTDATALVYDLDGNPADGAKVSWLLETIEDSNGNVITYNYVQSTTSQQKYLSEIVYGAAGHPLKIVFERETREDKITNFMRGVDFSSDERLKGIRVFSGGVEIGSYTLNYTYSFQSSFSQISSIVYTDLETSDAIMSNFEWQSESAVNSFSPKVDWSGLRGQQLQNRIMRLFHAILPMEICTEI